MPNSHKKLLKTLHSLDLNQVAYFLLEDVITFTPKEKSAFLKYVVWPKLKQNNMQDTKALTCLLNFLKPTKVGKP